MIVNPKPSFFSLKFGKLHASRYFCKATVFFLLATVNLITLSDVALASEIRLHDCEGNLRASTEIQAGETKGLKLSLVEQDANAKAKLSKMNSESVLELRAKEKSLTFGSIEAGEWKICKDDGQTLAFNSVEFIDGESQTLKVASLTAASVAVVSGIAIASSGSDGGSESGSTSATAPAQPDRAVKEPVSSLQSGDTKRPDGLVIVSSRCGNKKPSSLAATSDDCREGEIVSDEDIISPWE